MCNKIKINTAIKQMFCFILLKHLFYFIVHETRPAVKFKKNLIAAFILNAAPCSALKKQNYSLESRLSL